MSRYRVTERMATVDEFFAMRKSVGWGLGQAEAFAKGLERSLYGVCTFVDDELVGIARVIGDGYTCFYIQDVIVKPEFQRVGIGMAMMEKIMHYIAEAATPGAIVGLMAAKDKEAFYEKFGFWKRPNEHFGCGMMQFWKRIE